MQENFTGPDLFPSSNAIRFETINENERWKIDTISIDGIELNVNIRNITLLVISRNFLEDLAEQFPEDLVSCHLLHKADNFIDLILFVAHYNLESSRGESFSKVFR